MARKRTLPSKPADDQPSPPVPPAPPAPVADDGEPILTWDFENVFSDRNVSLAVGVSAHPTEVTGLAAQTGGGPAEVWPNVGTVFLIRQFGTNDLFLWITTTRPLFLAALTFRHWHNHNPGYPTEGGYDVRVRLDSGDGYRVIGQPLRACNESSGRVDTIPLGVLLPPGGHRIGWQPHKLRAGRDTSSEFFALKDLTLLGRFAEVGTTAVAAPQLVSTWTAEEPGPVPAGTLGHVTAVIENNDLVRYVVSGLFRGDPVHAGEYDWEYNSWRLTGPGSTVTFRFDRPDDADGLAVAVEWAGWGEDTRVQVAVNGCQLADDHAVHGSAWGNPMRETFPIPAAALRKRNAITLTLREDSPMVLFFREVKLVRIG